MRYRTRTEHTSKYTYSTDDWPRESRALVAELMQKYGAPQESSNGTVVWHGVRPWRRTAVYRKGTPHNFPRRHLDFVKQTVSYRVPQQRVADLLEFNGSLLIDRTRGELSVRCLNERMNFLLVNLARDIVLGTLSVHEARVKCARLSRYLSLNWPHPYMDGLQFSHNELVVGKEDRAADPDRAVRRLF